MFKSEECRKVGELEAKDQAQSVELLVAKKEAQQLRQENSKLTQRCQ